MHRLGAWKEIVQHTNLEVNSAVQLRTVQNLTFNGSDTLRLLHKQPTYLRQLRLFSWDMFYRQSQRNNVN